MEIGIDNKSYPIEIIRKNNKNMYLRIKNDLSITVTAPRFASNKMIETFVMNNSDYIAKVIRKKEEVKETKKDKFLYLGKKYDICYINKKTIELGEKKAFIGTNTNIDNWYKKQAKIIFQEMYDECFANFKYKRCKPELKIRKMTSKWGVNNITNKTITLNLELIKYNSKYLEYVIYHELSHLRHHDHSSNFWSEVEKYVPNYKEIRNEMKNL